MVITHDKFGGHVPKIKDPRLIPIGKSRVALNCCFDHGGVIPLPSNQVTATPTKAGTLKSIYLYQDQYWLSWDTDVDAILSPTPNDALKRVYFTENGVLKVTDSDLFDTGGTDYPMLSRLPSPPAPVSLVTAAQTAIPTYSNASAYDEGDLVKYTIVNESGDYDYYICNDGGAAAYAIPDHNPANEYEVHQVVRYPAAGSTYYRAKVAVPAEAWVPEHWELTRNVPGGAIGCVLLYLVSLGQFSLISPTDYESRAYTHTYVNEYGAEGPPPTAAPVVFTWIPGNSVAITIPAAGGVVASHNIEFVNLYRLNTDASGNAQQQLVAQLPVATASYTDTVPNASLGEVLPSAEWDAAPAGVTGLISLPNETLACFTGNTLCLSVPGFPHAWPVRYRKTTERDIMGLVAWGTTVVALTKGVPEAVTFTDPGSSVPERVTVGYSCSSKRSVVDMGMYAAYASPEGLVAIGPGVNKVLTDNLFGNEEWDRYAPESISGYMWEGRYVGFYDTGAKQAGFIYDPKSDNFVDLDFYATGGYRDPATGVLYLMVGEDIVSFATDAESGRTMDHIGRRESFKLGVIAAIQVLAPQYPVTVSVAYPVLNQTVAATVTSSRPQRIQPSNTMVDAADIRVYGANGATAVFLASTLEELPL